MEGGKILEGILGRREGGVDGTGVEGAPGVEDGLGVEAAVGQEEEVAVSWVFIPRL